MVWGEHPIAVFRASRDDDRRELLSDRATDYGSHFFYPDGFREHEIQRPETMTENIDSYYGAKLLGEENQLGRLMDFCFDERDWKIHAVVMEIGIGLPAKRVLILPCMLGGFSSTRDGIPLDFNHKESPVLPMCSMGSDIENRRGSRGSCTSRSTRSMEGKWIERTNGQRSCIGGFMVNRETWTITHIVTTTDSCNSKSPVLVPPENLRSFGSRKSNSSLR